jgi:hypothetical protein
LYSFSKIACDTPCNPIAIENNKANTNIRYVSSLLIVKPYRTAYNTDPTTIVPLIMWAITDGAGNMFISISIN